MKRTARQESVAYRIWRTSDGRVQCSAVVEITGARPIDHQVLHSPDGFETGYAGSGPADLALSILTDYLGSRIEAERQHQDFKWAFITPNQLNPGKHYLIRGLDIARWLEARDPRGEREET